MAATTRREPVVVKRSFSTKLQPVEAFGLSNEVLRPAGFELGKANPPKSQAWRRGGGPGSAGRSLRSAPQTITIEIESNRVTLTASVEGAEAGSASAQKMLNGYAQAVELLLAEGVAPDVARAMALAGERTSRAGSRRTMVSVAVIVFAVLGGGVYFASNMKNPPGPVKWVMAKLPFSTASSSSQSANRETSDDAEKKSRKSPPVVIVRRAGAQTNAQPHAESPQ